MTNPKNNLSSSQAGFSLILTLLILAGMLAATLAISEIVFRVTRSVGNASNSEMAYYGAETAAEKALYAVNKEYADIVAVVDGVIDKTEDTTAGTAGYKLAGIETATTDCSTGCLPDRLAPGRSYELDLDVMTDDPYGAQITLTGDLTNVILVDISLNYAGAPISETILRGTDTDFAYHNPYTVDTSDNFHKIRIINTGPTNIDYTVAPLDDITIASPIMQLIFKTSGFFHDTERQLDTKLNKWHIYGDE